MIRLGNMWEHRNEYSAVLFTGNSWIKQNGALVMGRGAALYARNNFQGLDLAIGQRIVNTCGHMGEYNIIVFTRGPFMGLGVLQVKFHFRDDADIALIERSLNVLSNRALAHPNARYACNYPGIGAGRLGMNQVEPLLQGLPDNIDIWRR